MDEGQFEAIVDLLTEIRDRLPEKAAAEKSTSVTSVMTDAIRLEKVRKLANEWIKSGWTVPQECGRGILDILDGADI